jgi:hypothetical protein
VGTCCLVACAPSAAVPGTPPVIGTGDALESEGHDRNEITLQGQQEALIRAVHKVREVVLDLWHGSLASFKYHRSPSLLLLPLSKRWVDLQSQTHYSLTNILFAFALALATTEVLQVFTLGGSFNVCLNRSVY